MTIASIKLKDYMQNATSTEKVIIHFILNHPGETSQMSIHKLASATYTSPSSIIRLCKKIGYRGYKDFIKSLIYEQAQRKDYHDSYLTIMDQNDEIQDTISKITYKNILTLEETQKLLDPKVIAECVDEINKCEKIVLFGMGASLLVARDACLKFNRVDKLALTSDDWHTQLLHARNVKAQDLAIAISYSGKTREVIDCVKEVKTTGTKVIAITKIGASPLSDMADINIYIPNNELTIRSAAISSRMAQLNIIDILYLGYINQIYDKSLEQLTRTQIDKE